MAHAHTRKQTTSTELRHTNEDVGSPGARAHADDVLRSHPHARRHTNTPGRIHKSKVRHAHRFREHLLGGACVRACVRASERVCLCRWAAMPVPLLLSVCVLRSRAHTLLRCRRGHVMMKKTIPGRVANNDRSQRAFRKGNRLMASLGSTLLPPTHQTLDGRFVHFSLVVTYTHNPSTIKTPLTASRRQTTHAGSALTPPRTLTKNQRLL